MPCIESLQAGRRVILDRVGLFADGVAVKRVGEETFALARQFVDEIVLVNTDEMCAAIQDIFEDTRDHRRTLRRAGGGRHPQSGRAGTAGATSGWSPSTAAPM